MIRWKIILGCTFAFACSWIWGQEDPDPADQVQLLREKYHQATGADFAFINGSLYHDAYPGTRGHPFLGTGIWSEGTLSARGKTYEGLPLRYDLVRDLLIYNHVHETGVFPVIINQQQIEGFTLQGHRFVHIRDHGPAISQKKSKGGGSGFYEEISRGTASLLLKWHKQYDPPPSAGSGRFISFEEVFVLKEGVLHRVTGKHSVVKALDDQEKLMRQYIREHRILLRGGDLSGYRQVVEYYNAIQP